MEKIEWLAKKVEMGVITEQILTNETVKFALHIDFGMSLLDINTLLDKCEYLTDKQARMYIYLNNHQYYLDNCSYRPSYMGYSHGLYKMELKLYSYLTEREKQLRIIQSL
jgi:hypothetical protein